MSNEFNKGHQVEAINVVFELNLFQTQLLAFGILYCVSKFFFVRNAFVILIHFTLELFPYLRDVILNINVPEIIACQCLND